MYPTTLTPSVPSLLLGALAALLLTSGCYDDIFAPDQPPDSPEFGENDNSTDNDDGPQDESDADDDDTGGPTDDDDPAPVQDAAQILSSTLPSSLECGEVFAASVTVQNTGLATWSHAGSYKLGMVDDDDPFYGSDTRILLSPEASVVPGSTWTFEFDLVAPATGGDLVTDWQMVHEGVQWFGNEASSNVSVECPPPSVAGWAIIACARNGSEICDDESFSVDGNGSQYGLLCDQATGGTSYIASNTGPQQADGNNRCQGWEDQGLNAWDYLNYVDSMLCNQVGDVLPIDLSSWAGGSLWFGSHDAPGGGGHMTSTCLVEWVE
jgi:hypothetical protein